MPESVSQLDFVRKTIDERIHIIQESSQWFRSRSNFYQAIAVVLSAAITIMSGLKITWLEAEESRNTVLILGAVSTVLAAFGAFFSPKQSWLQYSITLGELRALPARLAFSELDPSFGERERQVLDEIFSEYQRLLIEHNKRWQELRRQTP